MLSTEDSMLCIDRFRSIDQHDDDEEPIGKAKECSGGHTLEGEKDEIKKKHHHLQHLHQNHKDYIVDEDGAKIETLMADVEISLTDDHDAVREKAAFDDFVQKIDRETPKTDIIKRRHEKKTERRARKEKKKVKVAAHQQIISRPLKTPPSQSKRFPTLLVLDLDGTLVHSEFQRRTYQQHDFSLFNEEIFVYKRPYLDYFVSTILEWFDVAVWTASGTTFNPPPSIVLLRSLRVEQLIGACMNASLLTTAQSFLLLPHVQVVSMLQRSCGMCSPIPRRFPSSSRARDVQTNTALPPARYRLQNLCVLSACSCFLSLSPLHDELLEVASVMMDEMLIFAATFCSAS
jgi:hypothetical protein